jgi:hypothetical protein
VVWGLGFVVITVMRYYEWLDRNNHKQQTNNNSKPQTPNHKPIFMYFAAHIDPTGTWRYLTEAGAVRRPK